MALNCPAGMLCMFRSATFCGSVHLPRAAEAVAPAVYVRTQTQKRGNPMGSVIKKRRKRMSKKKHRKMLRRTRVQRRKLGK